MQEYPLPVTTSTDIPDQQTPVDCTIETTALAVLIVTALSARPLPAGRGREKTLLSWMQPRTLDTIPVPGGLHQRTATDAELGTVVFLQREREAIAGPADSTADVAASTLHAVVPLSVERG